MGLLAPPYEADSAVMLPQALPLRDGLRPRMDHLPYYPRPDNRTLYHPDRMTLYDTTGLPRY